MINGKKVLALIPARGGSKGIPNKNILKINRKPLIAYTIHEALSCDYIDAVVVSTDSEAIAKVATKAGAEVPFMRPEELAGDKAKSIDSVLHAITMLKNHSRFHCIVFHDIYDGKRLGPCNGKRRSTWRYRLCDRASFDDTYI